jgi:Uma2 family endonuclease
MAEYWLIDPETETAEQTHLQDGSYTLHVKAQTGQLTSHVIAGFVIPIRAIFDEQEKPGRAVPTAQHRQRTA